MHRPDIHINVLPNLLVYYCIERKHLLHACVCISGGICTCVGRQQYLEIRTEQKTNREREKSQQLQADVIERSSELCRRNSENTLYVATHRSHNRWIQHTYRLVIYYIHVQLLNMKTGHFGRRWKRAVDGLRLLETNAITNNKEANEYCCFVYSYMHIHRPYI